MARARTPWSCLRSLCLAGAVAGCTPVSTESDGGSADAAVASDAGPTRRDAGSEDAGTMPCGRVRPDVGRGQDLMLPGDDCLRCHVAGGVAHTSLTVGGTVFQREDCPEAATDAVVHVVDAVGRRLDLRTNEAGNVFSYALLDYPLHVSVEANGRVLTMRSPITRGSCNACHNGDTQTGWLAVPR